MRYFISLLFIMFYACSVSAEEGRFVRKKFDEVLSGKPSTDDASILPIYFTYPTDFTLERRTVRGVPTLFVKSASADVDGFISGDGEKSLGDGFFTVGLSMNVGYTPGANKFSDENDPKSEESLKKAGVTNIVSKRVDRNGVPVYESTMDGKNGRHAFIAYIALGETRSALRVMYFHPVKYSDRDVLIWRRFIDGLGGE